MPLTDPPKSMFSKIYKEAVKLMVWLFIVIVLIVAANVFIEAEKQKHYVINSTNTKAYILDSFSIRGDTSYLLMVNYEKDKYIISIPKTKK